jgi:hypothetical protein
LAERTVRTVKATIKKCKSTKQDIHIAMQHLRATPIDGNLPSPAELLFGRPIRTTLPGYYHPGPLQKTTDIYNHLQGRKEKMKHDHDRHAGPELVPLHIGQKVMIRDVDKNVWEPGEVSRICKEPRSYEVKSPNGSVRRRNRYHLRDYLGSILKTSEAFPPKHVRFVDMPKEPGPKPQENEDDKEWKQASCHENRVARSTGLNALPNQVTRSGRVCRKPARFRDDQ